MREKKRELELEIQILELESKLLEIKSEGIVLKNTLESSVFTKRRMSESVARIIKHTEL